MAAVISLISLGRGVEQFVKDQFNDLGVNMLIVTSKQPDADSRTRIEPFTTQDALNLTDSSIAPSIQQIAAQYNVLGFISDNGESMRTAVRGVTANYNDVRNWDTELGEFISQLHVDRYERVALIGPDVVEELYDQRDYDPTGSVVRLNGQTFTIIGVMKERSDPFNNDNGAILVPISTAQTRLANAHTRGGYEVSLMYVQAHSEETTYTAEKEIDAYFYAEHDIKAPDERDYDVTNFAEQLEIAATITALLTVFLGIIAGVSLLVGGIGIMNIMLVTVTERTQEIGLRKAMGAQPRDILVQFLFESILLSLIGGAIGIGLGWLVAYVGTHQVEQLTLTVDVDAVLLATAVSTFIGVAFGLFPANRAARMHPIDALRYE